jgi:FOG: HEAT repeat
MSESETYKELGALTRCKERWEESIPYVASFLASDSEKIQAKSLWMLGEMGLAFPEAIKSSVPAIATFLNYEDPLLREHAVNALGRIGRGCFESIQAYWLVLFRFVHDEAPGVRLAFVW